ncbi:MAG TPA: FtsX-like permease family protein, partial [Rhodothermales bacterium]|nr:FtsX-like permease family protein [Rhodothermales bacterium]
LAGGLVALALPGFNSIVGKNLTLGWATHWWYLPVAIGITAVVGILAGSYPAFLLSAFRPIQVLKNRLDVGRQRSALSLRRGLVVFQFALSIAIIAGTFVAMQQLRFMRNQRLGFDQEQVLVLPFNWDQAVLDTYETLKARLLENTAVQQVTASGDVPGRMFTSMSYWIEGMSEDARGGTNALIVDPDFAETYGLEMVAGRDFSPDLAANLGETFILNETAVAEMGLTPEEVIGKQFHMNTTGPVIGIVKDFHFEGLQKTLEPLVMTVWPDWFGYVSLRLHTTDLSETLASVEQTWASVVPNRPFEYFFLDDDFARQYEAEQRFERIFMTFALLAILISCLGLFGLAAFTAEQRTKEIGVRKVLGASVSGLVVLLSKDFLRLVLIAFVVATPLAYVAMHHWLDGFAYHINLGVGTFALAGLLTLFIALLTVSYQSIRAALADPVKSLRYE